MSLTAVNAGEEEYIFVDGFSGYGMWFCCDGLLLGAQLLSDHSAGSIL